MRRIPFRFLGAAACIVAASLSAPTAVQGSAKLPVISSRTYVGGSAKLTVTGSFKINSVIAINEPASISDGEMTWLQYGVSGAEAPNVLVTVSPYEVGIGVGLGKKTAIVGAEECKGQMTVAARSVTGKYECVGVASHEPPSIALGKVDIEIEFSAQS